MYSLLQSKRERAGRFSIYRIENCNTAMPLKDIRKEEWADKNPIFAKKDATRVGQTVSPGVYETEKRKKRRHQWRLNNESVGEL